MAENPSFDFASRDYQNIRDDLLNRASRVLPNWTDRDPSDFGVALVDLWAYMGDILHYYIDRAAGEAFLSTATQRDSVLAIANLYDYTPRPISPATGYVYAANSGAASVTIPAGTVITGTYDSVLYYGHTLSDVEVLAGTTEQISVQEGEIITDEVLTSSASGLPGQRYSLQGTGAVPSSVEVYVYEDGTTPTKYTRVTNIGDSGSNMAAFAVVPSTSGGFDVVFGNTISGRIPPSGAQVTATYHVCSGLAGNLPANKLMSFDTVFDGVAITSTTAFSGGSDQESISSMKRSVQSLIRTQDRAVTLQDYADYAYLVSGVYRAATAYTTGAGGASVTAYLMPFISDYTSYSSYSASVPVAVADEVKSTLEGKSTLGVTISVAPSVTINRVDLTANINVLSPYVAADVKTAVDDALTSLFDIYNIDFGKEITIGEVYKKILEVEGVSYVTISSYAMKTSGGAAIPEENLSPVQLLRKGTFTLTTTGGVTT